MSSAKTKLKFMITTTLSIQLFIQLCLAEAAYAAQPLKVISPHDPEFNHFAEAIDLNFARVQSGEIEYYADFSFRGKVDLGLLRGRIVLLNNGTKPNIKNLVIKIREQIYFIDTRLESVLKHSFGGHPFRLQRIWRGPAPGIYLLLRGVRRDSVTRLRVPVEIQLRIADTATNPVDEISYFEERFRP